MTFISPFKTSLDVVRRLTPNFHALRSFHWPSLRSLALVTFVIVSFHVFLGLSFVQQFVGIHCIVPFNSLYMTIPFKLFLLDIHRYGAFGFYSLAYFFILNSMSLGLHIYSSSQSHSP